MTCLGQCNHSLNFKQFQLSDAAYKENFCTFYEALKLQTGKLPFGTKSLVNTIREQPDSEGTKPSGVTNWKDLKNDGAWNYYKGLDKKKDKVLENRAHELNMA